MRQGNGADLLGVNDPRSSTIGVIYVTPQDDRKSVLAAILTQEKLGRKQVAVVLPEHNKAFQRPVDFDDLKTMRRKLQAQIVFIAPGGAGPAEFARQRRFAVYSSLENYASALRDELAVDGAAKKGWLFGSPRAKSNGDGNGNGYSAPNEPAALVTPRNVPSSPDEPRRGGGAAASAAAAGVLGAGQLMNGHNGTAHGASPANGAYAPNTPAGPAVPPATPHRFAEDEDDLGPPSPPASPAPYEDISGPTQAIPPLRPNGAMIAGAAAANNIIELPRRGGKPTTPLSPRELDPAPVVPPVGTASPVAEPEPTPKNIPSRRTSGKIPAVGLAAGAAALGGAAATNAVAPPRAKTGTTGTIARAGTATGAAATTVPRTGGGANVPPRSTPPGRGGGGGGGPANRRRGLLLVLLIGLIIALLIFGGIMIFARPGSNGNNNPFSNVFKGQAPATITITPDSKTVEDNYTIVGAGTTSVKARQVAVRNVLGSAQAPTATVKATGHNAHPATAAQGSLTFFNNAAVAQGVSSGTVFNVGGGVQIITNAAVSIPAGNGFTNGSKAVGAHAVPAGSAGNIKAFTLDVTACCATGISVSNTAAFTGGQNAVNYTFLKQSDVNGAISQATKDAAKQNALTDLQKQVKSTEQQIGATQCTPTTNVDQPIGDKGSNVTSANVTSLVKCTATVYDSQGAQNIVRGLLTTKASTSPGAGYGLVGAIQTSLTGQTKTGNVLSLFFSAKGIWVYQFTDAQKLTLAKAIAGKSIADAQTILNGTKGIGSARISYSGGNTLPTDPNQISIVIQPIAGLPGTGNGSPTAVVGSPTTTAPTVQSGTPPAVNGKGGINPPVGS